MEKETFKASVELSDNPQLIQLFGSQDQNIRFIEDSFQVQITHRGEQLFITGEEETVSQVKELLNQLQDLIARGISISKTDIITAVKMAKRGTLDYLLIYITKKSDAHLREKRFVPKRMVNNNTFMRLRKRMWYLVLGLPELVKHS